MKTTERHHLKDNELAIALRQAQSWAGSNSKTLITTIVAIVIVGGGVLGYMAWRNNTDNKARAMLAEAMVIEEARVMPPAPPAGTTNDPTRDRRAAAGHLSDREGQARSRAAEVPGRRRRVSVERGRAHGALSRRQDARRRSAGSTRRSSSTTR